MTSDIHKELVIDSALFKFTATDYRLACRTLINIASNNNSNINGSIIDKPPSRQELITLQNPIETSTDQRIKYLLTAGAILATLGPGLAVWVGALTLTSIWLKDFERFLLGSNNTNQYQRQKEIIVRLVYEHRNNVQVVNQSFSAILHQSLDVSLETQTDDVKTLLKDYSDSLTSPETIDRIAKRLEELLEDKFEKMSSEQTRLAELISQQSANEAKIKKLVERLKYEDGEIAGAINIASIIYGLITKSPEKQAAFNQVLSNFHQIYKMGRALSMGEKIGTIAITSQSVTTIMSLYALAQAGSSGSIQQTIIRMLNHVIDTLNYIVRLGEKIYRTNLEILDLVRRVFNKIVAAKAILLDEIQAVRKLIEQQISVALVQKREDYYGDFRLKMRSVAYYIADGTIDEQEWINVKDTLAYLETYANHIAKIDAFACNSYESSKRDLSVLIKERGRVPLLFGQLHRALMHSGGNNVPEYRHDSNTLIISDVYRFPNPMTWVEGVTSYVSLARLDRIANGEAPLYSKQLKAFWSQYQLLQRATGYIAYDYKQAQFSLKEAMIQFIEDVYREADEALHAQHVPIQRGNFAHIASGTINEMEKNVFWDVICEFPIPISVYPNVTKVCSVMHSAGNKAYRKKPGRRPVYPGFVDGYIVIVDGPLTDLKIDYRSMYGPSWYVEDFRTPPWWPQVSNALIARQLTIYDVGMPKCVHLDVVGPYFDVAGSTNGTMKYLTAYEFLELYETHLAQIEFYKFVDGFVDSKIIEKKFAASRSKIDNMLAANRLLSAYRVWCDSDPDEPRWELIDPLVGFQNSSQVFKLLYDTLRLPYSYKAKAFRTDAKYETRCVAYLDEDWKDSDRNPERQQYFRHLALNACEHYDAPTKTPRRMRALDEVGKLLEGAMKSMDTEYSEKAPPFSELPSFFKGAKEAGSIKHVSNEVANTALNRTAQSAAALWAVQLVWR